MNTAERLKYIRKQTGLSQKRFAEILEEKFTRINSIESGKQVNFPYKLAKKILDKFRDKNYNFQWLTTGEGEPCTILVRSRETGQEKAGKIMDKLIYNITDTEFNLVAESLEEKKELTLMLLKKLKSDEKAVKRFLLE